MLETARILTVSTILSASKQAPVCSIMTSELENSVGVSKRARAGEGWEAQNPQKLQRTESGKTPPLSSLKGTAAHRMFWNHFMPKGYQLVLRPGRGVPTPLPEGSPLALESLERVKTT